MTITQAIKWTAAKAEGWTGRRKAASDFETIADLAAAISSALVLHRDVDANEMFARLLGKVEAAKRLAVFTGKK